MKKISIIGNVTRDAVVRDAGNRKAIGFGVAVNERFKDRNNVQQERTTFFNCTIWRNDNTAIAQYITKGKKVFVEGIPDIDTYEREGKTVASIKINVRDIELLGGPAKTENAEAAETVSEEISSEPAENDDLPF